MRKPLLNAVENGDVQALKSSGQRRRYAPKTRTGCITCKIRRVKCDEGKPNCRRCTSTGRRCDGYALPHGPSNTAKTPENINLALMIDVPFHGLERRTFEFFRHRTAPCMSGYFQDTVWDRYVPQVCHSEPAVRHAVNALGALHEERMLRRRAMRSGIDVSRVQTNFHVKQYSKALAGLHKLLSLPGVPMDLVLMCSLLFIHFEALRECFVPALVHTENAIRLLHSSTTFDAKSVDIRLVRVLMRIDVQGAMYMGMRVPGLPFFTAGLDNKLPSAFHDLTEARDFINTWTCRMYHFMRLETEDHKFREPGNVPLQCIAKAQEFEKLFLDLDKLLHQFAQQPGLMLTAREQHGLGVLRSRSKINRILSATSVYAEASIYDSYLTEFEEIFAICNMILKSDKADRRLFCVSLDEGLLYPLFFTATHCRDSRIRRSALALLKSLPTDGNGIWQVAAMTRTAQLCIEFEEAICPKQCPECEDIPEWRRIHSAGFDGWNNESSKGTVKAHLRVRPNGIDGGWADAQEILQSWESASAAIVDEPVNIPGTWIDRLTLDLHSLEFAAKLNALCVTSLGLSEQPRKVPKPSLGRSPMSNWKVKSNEWIVSGGEDVLL